MNLIAVGAAVAAAVLSAAAPCHAQYVVVVPRPMEPSRVELTPMVGYALPNGVAVPGGSMRVMGSPTVGGALDIGDWRGAHLELGYTLQFTGIEHQRNDAPNEPLYGLALHHFQIGGDFDLLPGHVRPFLGFTLGAALFAPEAVANELWFETAFEGGVKLMFERDLGLRAQAQVISVYLDPSSRIFCGNGCYVPWFGGLGTTQLGFSIGPVIAF